MATLIELKSEISLPDHTQLPCENGTFVKNFQELPQSILLTESIWPKLEELHPDGQFCIGQDSGIYWRITEPPEKGDQTPDWFYVANVPPNLDGKLRRSYVMRQELIAPVIVIEFVSGNGAPERDKTPYKGKYELISPNERGHYFIPPLKLELGLWQGIYKNNDLPCIRWWDSEGHLLPTPEESLVLEKQRANAEKQRADILAQKLKELGINPDSI